MRKRAPIAVLFLGILVAACSTDSGDSRPSMSLPLRPTASDLPATVPPSDAPITGEVPAPILEAIRLHLAGEEPDVDAAAATVVKAEMVQWNDGSLGCPEPGMSYTQAIVPGFHVVLAIDGREYDYRASESGQVRRCKAPGPIGY